MFRQFRIARTLAALVLAVAGAIAGVAFVATPAQAAPSCPSGSLCFWKDNDYQNGRGTLANSNRNWAVFKHAACAGAGHPGNWSRCASSVYNNGTRCTARVWSGVGYTGYTLQIQRGTGYARLGNIRMIPRIPVEDANWNDEIQSNNWLC